MREPAARRMVKTDMEVLRSPHVALIDANVDTGARAELAPPVISAPVIRAAILLTLSQPVLPVPTWAPVLLTVPTATTPPSILILPGLPVLTLPILALSILTLPV